MASIGMTSHCMTSCDDVHLCIEGVNSTHRYVIIITVDHGQIRPGIDPGRGKNRSRGSPSLRNMDKIKMLSKRRFEPTPTGVEACIKIERGKRTSVFPLDH